MFKRDKARVRDGPVSFRKLIGFTMFYTSHSTQLLSMLARWVSQIYSGGYLCPPTEIPFHVYWKNAPGPC